MNLTEKLLKKLRDVEEQYGAKTEQFELDGIDILRQLVMATGSAERQHLFQRYLESGPPEQVERMKEKGLLNTFVQFADMLSLTHPLTESFYWVLLENLVDSTVSRIEKYAT
ncbi:MAG: hypothetical protein EAX87_12220 [Candidatus Thorarchaeota archaeon]|nr:hypothetical protein [Candidatus Thorarchaeota archaeon]